MYYRVNIVYKFILISVPLLFIFSCADEDNGEMYPAIEILVSETDLIPDKTTKSVKFVITVTDLSVLDYIEITKSGGSKYLEKIYRDKTDNPFTFSYEISKKDPQSFQFNIIAYSVKGNSSRNITVNVDNRWGFVIRKVERIARVTGRPMEVEKFYNPNNTVADWNVGGTDLGIVWEMNPGEYGIFFGDTFGRDFTPNFNNPGPNGSDWRSNVLAFSDDKNLDDGLTMSNMATDANGLAREIVFSQKSGTDITSIPTAAIRANDIDYVHYFNMRDWSSWETNYSGIYRSADNGQTWEKCEVQFSSNSPFGQGGYFKKDGYVYMIGTQTGRDSKASLARFLETDIEDKSQYEYWNGNMKKWIKGDENQATIIINDKVGELSFIYNETHKKWIIAYFNADRYNISMRIADEIIGPWSEPYELAAGKEYAQLYGSYFHPLSATGNHLYFLMSMWLPYNVFLMRAEIDNMGNFDG